MAKEKQTPKEEVKQIEVPQGTEGQINRGAKWANLRTLHIAHGHDAEIKWMDSQAAIVADEAHYANSIKKAEGEK